MTINNIARDLVAAAGEVSITRWCTTAVPDEISGHWKMRESLLAIIDGGFHLIGPFNKNLPKTQKKIDSSSNI